MPKQLRMMGPVPEYPKKITVTKGYVVKSFKEGDKENYISLLNNYPSKKLEWEFRKPRKTKHVKGPKGEEIAWRALELEKINEPCIISSWCMKREFFQKLTHKQNIYESAPQVVIEAFIRVGANLCPQFIMPSPEVEHIAGDPFNVKVEKNDQKIDNHVYKSLEDVKDFIETLPDPETLEKNFNIDIEVDNYAKNLLSLREIAHGEILFIGGFGQPDFMGGYNRFGYVNYLTAMGLYPEHIKRYFAYTGEVARLQNIAITEAIKKYNLAPFVYGGQDICFNKGPICSLEMLDNLYFPHLIKAVEPLHESGIKIIWHCDGDVRPILDRLIKQVGVSGLQGFQEETGCTLEKIVSHRTKGGKKLIIWGSVSVTRTLPYGKVEDIKNDVERCFKIAGPGGGFGLASTSSILPETPLPNILAMYEHGLKFGKEFLGTLLES